MGHIDLKFKDVIDFLSWQRTMSFIRSPIWFVKGMREYTRGGFEAASTRFVPTDLDCDISDKTFMVTGANSGLGKATATELAKRGAEVHLVCRDPIRGTEALTELRTVAPDSNKLKLHELDLSRSEDVIKFARKFTSTASRLDVLVNNAGCMVHERKLTDDGLELNFATNTMGTYLLTTELMSLLAKSSDPRVITVSSAGMLTVKLDTRDLQNERNSSFDGTMVYAQNKRQQIVMSRLWSNAHPEIKFFSMHPGWADTPAVQSAMPSFYNKLKDKLRAPEQGADTIVWLAISQAARSQPSGSFYQDRQATSEHLTIPLVSTHSTPEEEQAFMMQLDQIKERILSTADGEVKSAI